MKIRPTIEITEDTLEALFACARSNEWVAGWFEGSTVIVVADRYEWNGEGEDHTPENGLWELTERNMVKALETMSTDYSKDFDYIISKQSEIDAETGSIFIQLAIFGDVQYG